MNEHKEIHSEQTLLQLICCHVKRDVDRASSRTDPSRIDQLFFSRALPLSKSMTDPKYHFYISPHLLAVNLMKAFWRIPLLLALINSLMVSLIVAFFF